MNDITKVAIIGSGPAGYSAAIYAARAGLKPKMFMGNQQGGQLVTTTDVENYPGFARVIQGPWLMEEMRAQADSVGAELIAEHIKEVDFSTRPFKLVSENDSVVFAASVIIATGAEAKWLGLPSEQRLRGFGVSACATCDGFFYRDQKVIVIGGGNTAVEDALYLTKFASEVIVVHRRDQLRAEHIMQKRLFANDKIKIIWNSVLSEVLSDDSTNTVRGAIIENINDGSKSEHKADGVFIAIGHRPATEVFVGQIAMRDDGYIITEPGSTKTSVDGVFAAGDVSDDKYRQAITAAGTGCMAALDANRFLLEIDEGG